MAYPSERDFADYCAMRADERDDPFLRPGESAAPWFGKAGPAWLSNTPGPASGWRQLPPTPKQIFALKRFKAYDASKHITRGACSDALQECINKARERFNDDYYDDSGADGGGWGW